MDIIWPRTFEVEKEAALNCLKPQIGQIKGRLFCLDHPGEELKEEIVLQDEIKGKIIAVKCPVCGEKFRYSKLT